MVYYIKAQFHTNNLNYWNSMTLTFNPYIYPLFLELIEIFYYDPSTLISDNVIFNDAIYTFMQNSNKLIRQNLTPDFESLYKKESNSVEWRGIYFINTNGPNLLRDYSKRNSDSTAQVYLNNIINESNLV
jgi:hypothetical protein